MFDGFTGFHPTWITLMRMFTPISHFPTPHFIKYRITRRSIPHTCLPTRSINVFAPPIFSLPLLVSSVLIIFLISVNVLHLCCVILTSLITQFLRTKKSTLEVAFYLKCATFLKLLFLSRTLLCYPHLKDKFYVVAASSVKNQNYTIFFIVASYKLCDEWRFWYILFC